MKRIMIVLTWAIISTFIVGCGAPGGVVSTGQAQKDTTSPASSPLPSPSNLPTPPAAPPSNPNPQGGNVPPTGY